MQVYTIAYLTILQNSTLQRSKWFTKYCSGAALVRIHSTDKRLYLLTSSFHKGVAVRFLQLGIEMRPFFNRESLWVWPLFATVGGSFGYWLTGVEGRQMAILAERREALLDKRRRRAEREAAASSNKSEEGGILASTS